MENKKSTNVWHELWFFAKSSVSFDGEIDREDFIKSVKKLFEVKKIKKPPPNK